MSILRLRDRRLLLTFTVRDLHPPIGVRAIPGVETDDGFAFDFAHDRLMLDTQTGDRYQGGGFGPTVQLDDGTLVTSCSYRGDDDKTHIEVINLKIFQYPPQFTFTFGARHPRFNAVVVLEVADGTHDHITLAAEVLDSRHRAGAPERLVVGMG